MHPANLSSSDIESLNKVAAWYQRPLDIAWNFCQRTRNSEKLERLFNRCFVKSNVMITTVRIP